MTQPAIPIPETLIPFAYRAQDANGMPFIGTIEAPTLDEARHRLQQLGLRISSIEPAQAKSTSRPLGASDFAAFNEQLAQLTTAGLPVEHGLKLIADDLGEGRLARTVREIVDELDRGTSLPDALARHRGQFPPLYARLVEAGIKSNNLSGLLLNLGQHLETVRRLRAALWRAISYPLMVLIGLALVLLFLAHAVFPQFRTMYQTFNSQRQILPSLSGSLFSTRPTLPVITNIIFFLGDYVVELAVVCIILFLLVPILWRFLYSRGKLEGLTLRLPLVGLILKRSLLARWCDIVRLGVLAGLDLPAALRLAGEAIASPGLWADGQAMAGDLEAGRRIDAADRRFLLPATVPAAIELASQTQNLPDTLESLSRLYQRQAETRLENLPAILTPLLLALIAIPIGMVIAGLLLPLLNYIRFITGGAL